MSELSPAEVVLWQKLGKHLKTETEVSKPEIISDGRYRGRQTEVLHLKVRFSNTALDEPDFPKIVFTGVGLGIVSLHSRSSTAPKWAKYGVKMEKSARTLQSRTIVGAVGSGFTEARRWEDLTDDESRGGIALFPGDSATLELTIPLDDIREYELHVEGSVSRRHFFHYDRIVRIPQGKPKPYVQTF